MSVLEVKFSDIVASLIYEPQSSPRQCLGLRGDISAQTSVLRAETCLSWTRSSAHSLRDLRPTDDVVLHYCPIFLGCGCNFSLKILFIFLHRRAEIL